MKKIDFRQRAAKTEERKRKSKYADVMVRATVMGLMKPDEDVDRIRCEECGETISYNAKEPETQHKCKKCGHVTQLRALKPMYAECKACGSSWKYMTNRNTAELTQECLQCGSLIDMEMNSRRTAYVTKTKRGGQDLQEVDSRGECDE